VNQPKNQLTLHSLSGYAPPVGYALACLEKERERPLETVAGLSIAELDARADGSNSIGTLLYHIADIELDWLYSEILESDIPSGLAALFPIPTRTRDGHLSVVAAMTLAEHEQRLTRVRHEVLERLQNLSETDFYRVRNLEPYDVNPAWVLYHLLEHEAKHGEQIARTGRAWKGEAR
jgi:uncharacterized damage-inducible protein DinB